MAMTLSSISRESAIKAPTILLLGPNGIGKTTFFGGSKKLGLPPAPSPVFAFFEDSLGGLAREIAKFDNDLDGSDVLTEIRQLREIIALLTNESHDHRMLVIDGLEGVEAAIHTEVCQEGGVNSIEKYEGGYGKGFTRAQEKMRELIELLKMLRRNNVAVGITGHVVARNFEDPTSESFKRWEPRCNEKFIGPLVDWCDCVLYADQRKVITREDSGFGKSVKRGIGSGERVLNTEPRPWYACAKNRFGLPAEIEMNWTMFQDALRASQTTQENAA